MIWFLAFIHLFALQTALIQVGDKSLTVEVADTPKDRAHGLMRRKSLDDGKGMLFVYDKPEVLHFWMKNTEIPLSIAFIDSKKTLFKIADMDPPAPGASSFPTTSSETPALYALEVPQGWFEKNGIEAGVKFSFLDQPNKLR